VFLKLIPFLRVFTLKRVDRKTVECLGFFADKERRKGKEGGGKGDSKELTTDLLFLVLWVAFFLSWQRCKMISSSSSFTKSSTPMPSSVVVIGFLGGKILCCGVRVFFSLWFSFFVIIGDAQEVDPWGSGGLEWKLVVYLCELRSFMVILFLFVDCF
jgi:hypothetical protein